LKPMGKQGNCARCKYRGGKVIREFHENLRKEGVVLRDTKGGPDDWMVGVGGGGT